MRKSDVMTFKISEDFRAHIESEAKKRNLKPGTFVKAVLKKYTKFKEKELI